MIGAAFRAIPSFSRHAPRDFTKLRTAPFRPPSPSPFIRLQPGEGVKRVAKQRHRASVLERGSPLPLLVYTQHTEKDLEPPPA